MPLSNTKNKKLYAEDRREQNRKKQEQNIKLSVKETLSRHFAEIDLANAENIEELYPSIYEFINRKAKNTAWKKYAHAYFRDYIKTLSVSKAEVLKLPHLIFTMQRDLPVLHWQWFDAGHVIDHIIEKLWDYWVLAENSQSFSDDEVIGNIFLSAILYGGLSQKNTLEALLFHLKNPAKIKTIAEVNIIFLEPLSPSYGDIFIDDRTIRKSRNFVPDHITRLWLIHFNLRNIRSVHRTVEDYLKLIFSKIGVHFNTKMYKALRDYAYFNWMQLSTEIGLDPALSECLNEHTETCGLSESEFGRYFKPQFKYLSDNLEQFSSVTSDISFKNFALENTDQAIKQVQKIHKDLLKLIRTTQSDHEIEYLIIDYAIEHAENFNEYSKRIMLWLISLYQPKIEHIEKLAEVFLFSVALFQQSFKDNQVLVDGSIYTYYTRIAEPWLTHSLQYLDHDDSFNNILNLIYNQIVTNTRIAEDALQPDFKRSKAQTIFTLKRFHRFQQIVFQAEAFEFDSISTYTKPRARIIGKYTYSAILQKLDAQANAAFIDGHHYKILKLIFILAYRTGMRINEILGLRVRDVEGIGDFSLWIQGYGSKKQGNHHQLKTDSAERVLPIYCLLKADEYILFKTYVTEKRLLKQSDHYLFSAWNDDSKLNQNTVTSPFKMLLNELFKEHDYSFHSFRHTAANNFSLLLNCEYDVLVHQLTDYTEDEYHRIRKELLRQKYGQNHWFIIAHLLGHLEPNETFRSYIHLSYLIAGEKLSKYTPNIDNELAKKMIGFMDDVPELHFLKEKDDADNFEFSKHSKELSKLLLNDQTDWLNSNAVKFLTKNSELQIKPHQFLNYFAGTAESQISFNKFFQCLNLLEIHRDPIRVSSELCLPLAVVEYWFENAIQLGQLKSLKGNPRLLELNNLNGLKPAMIDTEEDLEIVRFFFSRIQKLYNKEPEKIQAVFNVFLNRVTASHTGIHYRWKNIGLLEQFYSNVKDLFPKNYWHLLGQNLELFLDENKHPLLLKLAKSKSKNHPDTQEDYIRLQLYCTKQGKALPAFKFCLHLACIGRPKIINDHELIIDK